ncbi:MAG: hypothetical protein H6573_34955 [Lewinellaceae bacterium]|nr:hypothetical protein [Lewinellaceae bacterium]
MELLRPLAHFLIDPLIHFWLVLLLGLLLRRKKAGRYLLIYAGLWFFLISASPLPSWLAAQRESRYPVLLSVPDSQLVCSGYSSSGRTAQAEVLAQAAVLLGVSPADTLMVKTPAHTEAEAIDYAARFGAAHPLLRLSV